MSFSESLGLLLQHAHVRARVEDVRTLEQAQDAMAIVLPADYKAFLMAADGCETKAPLRYYHFYGLTDLPERLDAAHPGSCFPIATDDSDEFAFDLRRHRASASYEVVSYPLSSQAPEEVEWVAEDFAEFLQLIVRRLGPRREL